MTGITSPVLQVGGFHALSEPIPASWRKKLEQWQPHWNILLNSFAVAISVGCVLEWNRYWTAKDRTPSLAENVAVNTAAALVAFYVLYWIFRFQP